MGLAVSWSMDYLTDAKIGFGTAQLLDFDDRDAKNR
jgi:hypothetical protein